MPGDRAPAVLHVSAAVGGGAERYIRDLAAGALRPHHLLHAGPAVDVLEDVAAHRFVPLAGLGGERAAEPLRRWREAAGVGIVHLHGIDETCLRRLATLRGGSLPYLVTLHDLTFLNPRAFEADGMPARDAAWLAGIASTLAGAAGVVAPSAFVREVAVAALPGLDPKVIAPGSRTVPAPPAPAPPDDFAAAAPRHVVAVAGAVGPHKGSALLEGIAAALEGTDIVVVVIGYTDTRLTRGWVIPGRLYVHGAYQDDTLGGWLAAYRAEVVLFPNRLPEGFSYTLSEVWAAGLPVIVPDHGALGARVAQHGGGWRLPASFGPADAALLLARLLSDQGASELARVKSGLLAPDPLRIPPLSTMNREIEALYAQFAMSPSLPADEAAAREALTPLLAANLDGFVFRKELVNLANRLQQAEAALEAARARCAQLEHDGTAWAAKLEGDIERLREENRRLGVHEAALRLLPAFVGDFLRKRTVRARR